jgi:A/G-specific adenine glycosylase
VWEAAEAVLPAKRAGDFNQALMELGALVCTTTAPDCPDCPVAKWCTANRLGLQTVIPPPAKRKETVEVREVGVVVRDGATVLLCRRPPTTTRWANMWEFPHGEVQAGEGMEAAAVRVAKELTGLRVKPGAEVTTLRHGVTRWSITLTCVEAARAGGAFRPGAYAEAAWVEVAKLGEYPVSAPQRRLADELARTGRQRRLF